MVVGMQLYNVNYWMVVYAPYDSKDNLNIASFDELMKMLEK